MAQFSTNIDEFVSKDREVFHNMDDFYAYIDTIKMNRFEKKVNFPTIECVHNREVKKNHYSDIRVTIELAEKDMLRHMKWIDSNNRGIGNRVLKDCYIVVYEIEAEEESTYTVKYFIYNKEDITDAINMFNTICSLYKD